MQESKQEVTKKSPWQKVGEVLSLRPLLVPVTATLERLNYILPHNLSIYYLIHLKLAHILHIINASDIYCMYSCRSYCPCIIAVMWENEENSYFDLIIFILEIRARLFKASLA